MLLKTLIFSLLTFLFAQISTSQTNVSGGIYTNTNWTLANSPYLVTNNIVVFPGATLTIDPGVEVKIMENGMSGTQYYIETRGTINMVGQPSALITFSANTEMTTVGTWKGFVIKNSQGGSINYNYVSISNAISCFEYDAGFPNTIQLNDCNFSYNNYAVTVGTNLIADNCTFTNNEIAVYGWSVFNLTNCVFSNNSIGLFIYPSSLNINNCTINNNASGIQINAGSVNGILIKNSSFDANLVAINNANNGLIDSCDFTNNVEGVINTNYLTVSNSNFNANSTALQVGFGTQVNDCDIENNVTGVALGPISFGQPTPTIINNRICYNQLYNIDNRTDINMFVPTNCFCTQDSTEIEAKIFDGYDDITKGLISYAIFDSTCTNVLKYVNKDGGVASLNNTENPRELHFYPNPVNDQLTIENSGNYNNYQILSMEGRLLTLGELKIGGTQIDTSVIPFGIFFIRFSDGADQSKTFKLVRN